MNTKDIVYIALFAALIAVLGVFPPITVPVIGVPITAQSMGVMLAGALAGAKRGGLAVVLFLLLVAVGLPLLSGGRGGVGVFFGASAGFLFAYPLAAVIIGSLFERNATLPTWPVAFAYVTLGGILFLYAIGIPWIAVVANIPLSKAAIGSIAYIPGDLIKAGLTVAITLGVRRAYPAH